jgi:putative DNA primase/helicase
MTLFESDRIKIIPFNRHFTAEERDIDLKSFFAKPENLSGILNWCLEGFKLYMAEGLDMPDSVEQATMQYRQQSDRIMMFTSQCVKKETGQELRAQAVYSRYKDWCAENGFKYENAANFRKKMEQAGYVYSRRRPKDSTSTGMTTMVNDISWVVGEEPDQDFVPVSENG